jgi:diacylglycerol kinase family enzyme
MAATESALRRAEELAERVLPDRRAKKRMLVIVNPYATTVSDRLKNLVVYALQGRYDVEAVETQARHHATELTREAARSGYDVVVAFGGDGTVNEAANGLAGTDTPVTCLPGGATNVFARTLGIPNDVVDATEHLLRIADDFQPRRVDTGLVNGRHFVFASGVGLDASVVERVDSHPRRKARFGEWYFTYAAVASFNRKYLYNPPRMVVETDDGQSSGAVTVIVQNSDPFTYFGNRPIRVCTGAGLDTGRLGLAALRRASVLDMPTLIARIFSSRPETLQRHRQVIGFDPVRGATVSTADGRPLPVEVDGDFIGDFEQVRYEIAPRSLAVVA